MFPSRMDARTQQNKTRYTSSEEESGKMSKFQTRRH